MSDYTIIIGYFVERNDTFTNFYNNVYTQITELKYTIIVLCKSSAILNKIDRILN